jgi:hypothetical protein
MNPGSAYSVDFSALLCYGNRLYHTNPPSRRQFLPELVSGRGTIRSRRRRMVEGLRRPHGPHPPKPDGLGPSLSPNGRGVLRTMLPLSLQGRGRGPLREAEWEGEGLRPPRRSAGRRMATVNFVNFGDPNPALFHPIPERPNRTPTESTDLSPTLFFPILGLAVSTRHFVNYRNFSRPPFRGSVRIRMATVNFVNFTQAHGPILHPSPRRRPGSRRARRPDWRPGLRRYDGNGHGRRDPPPRLHPEKPAEPHGNRELRELYRGSKATRRRSPGGGRRRMAAVTFMTFTRAAGLPPFLPGTGRGTAAEGRGGGAAPESVPAPPPCCAWSPSPYRGGIR